jgi:hypothetical protein
MGWHGELWIACLIDGSSEGDTWPGDAVTHRVPVLCTQLKSRSQTQQSSVGWLHGLVADYNAYLVKDTAYTKRQSLEEVRHLPSSHVPSSNQSFVWTWWRQSCSPRFPSDSRQIYDRHRSKALSPRLYTSQVYQTYAYTSRKRRRKLDRDAEAWMKLTETPPKRHSDLVQCWPHRQSQSWKLGPQDPAEGQQ